MRNSLIQTRIIEKIALALGELNEKVAFVIQTERFKIIMKKINNIVSTK